MATYTSQLQPIQEGLFSFNNASFTIVPQGSSCVQPIPKNTSNCSDVLFSMVYDSIVGYKFPNLCLQPRQIVLEVSKILLNANQKRWQNVLP